jgi:hypothetical protein
MNKLFKVIQKVRDGLSGIVVICFLVVFSLVLTNLLIDWGNSWKNLDMNTIVTGVTAIIIFLATLAVLSIEYSSALRGEVSRKNEREQALSAGKYFFQSTISFLLAAIFLAALKYIVSNTILNQLIGLIALIGAIVGVTVLSVFSIISFVYGLLNIVKVLVIKKA